VPAIMRWPGQITPGTVSDQIWAFWDFLPTACDPAGVETPTGLDGLSFAPIITNQGTRKTHPYLYWEFHEGGAKQAVRHGDWRSDSARAGSTARAVADPDSDGDGLSDFHEVHKYRTDSKQKDTATRNRGPRRRLSGKDRFTDDDRLLPVWHNDQLQVLRWGNRSALGWVRWTCSASISAGMTGLSCAGEASTGAGPRSSGMRTGRAHGKKGRPGRLAHGGAWGPCEAPHLEDERVELRKAGNSPYRPSAKKWTRLHRELRLPSLVLM
jgi:hypothetical protein